MTFPGQIPSADGFDALARRLGDAERTLRAVSARTSGRPAWNVYSTIVDAAAAAFDAVYADTTTVPVTVTAPPINSGDEFAVTWLSGATPPTISGAPGQFVTPGQTLSFLSGSVAWHVLNQFGGAPQWQTPGYSAGWSDYTATPGRQPLRYALLPSGMVNVVGHCVAASSGASQQIFTLPAGFRPALHRWWVGGANAGAGDVPTRIDVRSDGTVNSYVIGTTIVSVEALFVAEQ